MRSCAVLICLVVLVLVPAQGAMSSGISTLMPVEKDAQAWHKIDRQEFIAMVSSRSKPSTVADALHAEWVEITNALEHELTQNAYVHPEMGFRVYDSDTTSRIHVLSLAKKAREQALTTYVSTGGFAGAAEFYPSMWDPGQPDGTSLDQNGLANVPGATIASEQECIDTLASMTDLAAGALRGFAYYISPYVFPADVGHAFTSNQAGADEWVAISALSPELEPDGFPAETIAHETGHLLHFEYMGPVEEKGALWREYASMRDRPLTDVGRWENLTVENFAEDIRVSVLDEASPHRGKYGQPDEETKSAVLSLVDEAVRKGPAGSFRISDLRYDDGKTTLSVLNAPASTGVFVTREQYVTLAGNAKALEDGIMPLVVMSARHKENDARYPVSGDFELNLPVAKPGRYDIRRACLDSSETKLIQYDTGLSVISLGAESEITRDISSHWSKADVLVLMALGAIGGYPDGQIRPDLPVTRGEFLKMLAVLTGVKAGQARAPFDDSRTHWSEPYVSAAWNAGWLRQAYQTRALIPDGKLSRGELAQVLGSVLGTAAPRKQAFPDVGARYNAAVSALVEKGVLKGFPDGLFHPTRPTSRAEAATALVRLKKALLGG